MISAHQLEAKNHALKTLLAAAFDLSPKAIFGVPEWNDAEHYDILAKTPGDTRPNLEEQMAMLRKLLIDRFKVVYHREPREMPVYALTVAKGGTKLHESTISPDATPEGPPALAFVIYPDEVKLPAKSATVREFASVLQRAAMDRPVIDQTGITGRSVFDRVWLRDVCQFGGRGLKAESGYAQARSFCGGAAAAGPETGSDKRFGGCAGCRSRRTAVGKLNENARRARGCRHTSISGRSL